MRVSVYVVCVRLCLLICMYVFSVPSIYTSEYFKWCYHRAQLLNYYIMKNGKLIKGLLATFQKSNKNHIK